MAEERKGRGEERYCRSREKAESSREARGVKSGLTIDRLAAAVAVSHCRVASANSATLHAALQQSLWWCGGVKASEGEKRESKQI